MTTNDLNHCEIYPIEDDQAAIRVLAKRLSMFLKRPLMYTSEDNVAAIVEGLEYSMQLVLHLPLDRNYHKYWYMVDGCKCIAHKMDNQDRWGTPYRVIAVDCPYHGDKSSL